MYSVIIMNPYCTSCIIFSINTSTNNMKKPCNIDKILANDKNMKKFTIKFNDDSTHEEVVYQFVTGLVNGGFAAEKEVLEGVLDIVQLEYPKTEGN